jgi:hypothetical protein
MSPRTKIRILAGLALVLAAVVLFNFQGGSPVTKGAAADEAYRAIAVENPALHLDRIERLRKLEYHPTGRDIFTAQLPPPPKPKVAPPVAPVGPPAPPPDPPLTLPFKFYGFSIDAQTGKRRGFFTNGEDVFIASEGELVQGRFRVVSLGNTTAEIEEVSSAKRAKLTIEGPGATPQ